MPAPVLSTTTAPDVAFEAFASQLCQEEQVFIASVTPHSGRGDPTLSGPSTMTAALETNWMRRTKWESLFSRARKDVLVALNQLPCRIAGEPQPLRIVLRNHQDDGPLQVIESPAEDEDKINTMLAAMDRLFD